MSKGISVWIKETKSKHVITTELKSTLKCKPTQIKIMHRSIKNYTTTKIYMEKTLFINDKTIRNVTMSLLAKQ